MENGEVRKTSQALVRNKLANALEKIGVPNAAVLGSDSEDEPASRANAERELIMDTPVACLLKAAPNKDSRVKQQVYIHTYLHACKRLVRPALESQHHPLISTKRV